MKGLMKSEKQTNLHLCKGFVFIFELTRPFQEKMPIFPPFPVSFSTLIHHKRSKERHVAPHCGCGYGTSASLRHLFFGGNEEGEVFQRLRFQGQTCCYTLED